MNAFLAPNSSPKPARYFSSFWKPPRESTSFCCHSKAALSPASVATVDLPLSSKYVGSNWAPMWVIVDS